MGKKKRDKKSGKASKHEEALAPAADKKAKRSKDSEAKQAKKTKKTKDTEQAPKSASDASGQVTGSMRDALRVAPGSSIADIDPRSTPAFDGDKEQAAALMESVGPELAELQERLYAEGRDGDGSSVLLVVQGMDTSGKGGVMRHVIGAVDPQGVELTAFKAPSAAEKAKPFLWRIRQALPKPGFIGVFDRSHYEDVLIVRVRNLVPQSTWGRRYGQINTFESSVQAKGTRIIKVMLHISSDEQKARLAERLDRPDKYWKYNPGDVDEREQWPAYQEAYQAVIDKTSTDENPWYVVPADRKWYARLAVQQLLLEVLREIDPQWPPATFDIETEKQRLADS